MIGTLRSAAAIALILIASLPMALWQIIALKSNGRLDDGRIPRLWHRMAVRLLGIRIHVRGAPSKKRPLLIASNHISWSDIMVLGSLDEIHFIAKAEVATWPLFGAAQMALSEGGSETVSIQPVAIAYTRLQGLPMERRHRPHAAWIGDLDLMPHLLRLLREGAMDVEVHFGEPITFIPGDDRKKLAREVERQVRDMFAAALRNPA